jgi:acyl-coenzyme A synthetase/AMP-(fatty) acid ligase
MYGLTEAFRSSSLDPSLVDQHPDSIGTAIPFAELMVVRPDGSEAAAGEDGELVHAGPLVAQGYWNDPGRTAERFRPAPDFSRFGGTAVWSGDTIVKGEDGLFRFRGRDDAMIKVSGNRISPTEVEEAALASGSVADAAAFGVADERLGQAIVLVAVAKADDAEKQLTAWLRRELPQHMQPQRVVWKDRLPVGPNGKLDRTALKAEIL